MNQTDVTQVQRQLYILSLLSDNPRAFTIIDLQERIESTLGVKVSRKTIERDIDTLSTEFSICEDERNGTSVYYADKVHLKNVQYSIPELLSLYFTRELLEEYKGMSIAQHALDLVNRLIDSAPSVNRRYIKNLGDRLKVSQSAVSPETDIDPELHETLQTALADQHRLRMEYYAFSSDEITQREFDPYVLEIQEGRWHLVGYCHLRQAVRDLRVSRIRRAELLEDHYVIPRKFYETHQQKRFQYLAGDQRILMKLSFVGQAARLVQEYHSAGARLTWVDESTLHYERTVPLNPEVMMWVLGFGAQAEVLEPSHLRLRVQEEAGRMRSLYGNGSPVVDEDEAGSPVGNR